MRLQVKGRNVEVSESIRRYAEEKLGKLERHLADPTQVELELAVETNPSIAEDHVADHERGGMDVDAGTEHRPGAEIGLGRHGAVQKNVDR